jgi:hypothetical protein
MRRVGLKGALAGSSAEPRMGMSRLRLRNRARKRRLDMVVRDERIYRH